MLPCGPQGSWSPASSLRTVLLSIQLLLSEPNPNDPLDADAVSVSSHTTTTWFVNGTAACQCSKSTTQMDDCPIVRVGAQGSSVGSSFVRASTVIWVISICRGMNMAQVIC